MSKIILETEERVKVRSRFSVFPEISMDYLDKLIDESRQEYCGIHKITKQENGLDGQG